MQPGPRQEFCWNLVKHVELITIPYSRTNIPALISEISLFLSSFAAMLLCLLVLAIILKNKSSQLHYSNFFCSLKRVEEKKACIKPFCVEAVYETLRESSIFSQISINLALVDIQLESL